VILPFTCDIAIRDITICDIHVIFTCVIAIRDITICDIHVIFTCDLHVVLSNFTCVFL
jgi:hypothetical protein